MEQATWIFRPIKREELIDDILSPVYKAVKEKQTTGVLNPNVTAHKLATMFLVFAVGALVDLTLEPCKYSRDILSESLLRLSSCRQQGSRDVLSARSRISIAPFGTRFPGDFHSTGRLAHGIIPQQCRKEIHNG